MIPPRSLSKKVYWPMPRSSLSMLFVSIVLSHFRAQPHVLVVKRCFFGCAFAHGPSLDLDKCGASVRVIGDGWISTPHLHRGGECEIASRFPDDERVSSPAPQGVATGRSVERIEVKDC